MAADRKVKLHYQHVLLHNCYSFGSVHGVDHDGWSSQNNDISIEKFVANFNILERNFEWLHALVDCCKLVACGHWWNPIFSTYCTVFVAPVLNLKVVLTICTIVVNVGIAGLQLVTWFSEVPSVAVCLCVSRLVSIAAYKHCKLRCVLSVQPQVDCW